MLFGNQTLFPRQSVNHASYPKRQCQRLLLIQRPKAPANRTPAKLVQNHNGEDIWHAHFPLQVRTVIERRLILHIHIDLHHANQCILLSYLLYSPALHDRSPNHLSNLGLLETVRPYGALLYHVQHSPPRRTLAELSQLRHRTALRQGLPRRCNNTQECQDASDGLSEEAGARVSVEDGEEARCCLGKEEGAVVWVEDGGKEGVEVREGLGGEGESSEGFGMDLFDEIVEGRIWQGGDVVVVDHEERVSSFDNCWMSDLVCVWEIDKDG